MTSIYKPPASVNPNTYADSDGKASSGGTFDASAQPPAEVILKRVIAGVVLFAGTGVVTFPEHTVAHKVCAGIVALGAALGITSRGVVPR